MKLFYVKTFKWFDENRLWLLVLGSNQRPIGYCTTLIFTSIIYYYIICSLDFIFTISLLDLGRWCKVSTHSFRLARYCRVIKLLTSFTELATFFIYKFPYRAANILILKVNSKICFTAERSTNWAKREYITWRQPIFSAR